MTARSNPHNALSLQRAAGAVLMVGIAGPELSPMEAAWLKLIRPGGIILFRRNLENAVQSLALLRAVQDATGNLLEQGFPPMLRSVDVEGGTVDRLRDMVAPMPSAYSVARTNTPALFAEHGRLIGREIRLAGFNATLAPVLDLRTTESEKVMVSRAASKDPAEVTRYAQSFLDGLRESGALGCGKHFPGLGSGSVDSHNVTPRIEKSFDLLWREDLFPYRKLAKQLPMAMVSHAVYPSTAAAEEPASVSPFWIREVLAKKIGFRGLIVSDDMEMGGILSQTGLADAALRSLAAGTHLIEICHDPARVFTTYEALLHEAESSPAFARKLRRAAAYVLSFRQGRLPCELLSGQPNAAGSLRETRDSILRFAEEVDHADALEREKAVPLA